MADSPEPDVLVQRLHQLAVQHGLTIKEMAEKSGIPKSSLEGYMRLRGAKRPGVDALIAIADAMDVSIDWLVGRSDGRQVGEDERRRIALAMFKLVVKVLHDIEQAQGDSPSPIIKSGKVGLHPIEDFAVRVMIHFLSKEKLFPGPDFDTFRIVAELVETPENDT
jgi:transcriptional regulator with XRE-family HTH domain